MSARSRGVLVGLAGAFLSSGSLHAQVATTVTLSVSPGAPKIGQPVTLKATVSPATASGAVAFYDGVALLGEGSVNSGGIAQITTILLNAGTHSLLAAYTGPDQASHSTPYPYIVSAGSGSGFSLAAPYAVGATPQAVTAGDFNGDGNADLAIANSGGQNVSVLLGNGDGTFTGPANYGAGTGPSSVAVGDFNGDGKADLVVANHGTNNVSILIGKGDGTFQPAVNYDAGSSPSSVTVGDFNGDGKADLVVADAGATNVSVLLGNGDGTFQPAVGYPAGASPSAVAVGDFDGDGFADLAVANSGGGIAILLGNGDGTFQPALNYAAGSGPSSIVVGDFNRDGNADLAVANGGGTNISVLLGNGGGGFSTAMNYPVSGNPYSLAVGDFNGDGKLDLAVAAAGSTNLSVLAGEGNGKFQAAAAVPAGATPRALAIGDFNGDGRADLISANSSGTGVSVLLATASPATWIVLTSSPNPAQYGQPVTLTAEVTPSNATGVVEFLAGDTAVGSATLDGSGRAGFIAANLPSGKNLLQAIYAGPPGVSQSSASNVVSQVENTVAGQSLQGGPLYSAAYSGSTSVAVGDFNGDGILDVVVASGSGGSGGPLTVDGAGRLGSVPRGTVTIFLGNGDGTFYGGEYYFTGESASAMVSADFNGDGFADLALACDPYSVCVLLGNGDGTFQAATSSVTGSPLTGSAYPGELAVADFNGDGIADLAVANRDGGNDVVILLGNGDGTFQPGLGYSVGVGAYEVPYSSTSLAVGDFNRDGVADLAVVAGTNNVSVMLGNGNGTFQPAVNYALAHYPSTVAVADVNGDGIIDLVFCNDDVFVPLSVLPGKGDGTFQVEITSPVNTSRTNDAYGRTLAVGDLNGDGKPDVIFGGQYGILAMTGNGDGTFAFQAFIDFVANSLAAADFNGDGSLDLAVSDGGLFLLLNQVNPIYQFFTNPGGPAIVVDGATITPPWNFEWPAGSSHTVDAPSPQIIGGVRYIFQYWFGYTLPHTIVAAFPGYGSEEIDFSLQDLLTTSVTPGGAGAIVVSPSSPDGFYDRGTNLQLTPVPASGYVFSSFTCSPPIGYNYDGGCVPLGISTNPLFLTMNYPELVTATFTALPSALSISKSHAQYFAPGQSAAYTVIVYNAAGAGPSNGTVTVTETLPAGLTLLSMAGTGWTCPMGQTTCTRADPLIGGANYPITVTVSVTAAAGSQLTNLVSLTGGGSPPASASDLTTIYGSNPCDVDGNGIVNLTDLQSLFNQALGKAAPAGDLSKDGWVNTADLQIEINSLLGLGCAAR